MQVKHLSRRNTAVLLQKRGPIRKRLGLATACSGNDLRVCLYRPDGRCLVQVRDLRGFVLRCRNVLAYPLLNECGLVPQVLRLRDEDGVPVYESSVSSQEIGLQPATQIAQLLCTFGFPLLSPCTGLFGRYEFPHSDLIERNKAALISPPECD